MKYGQSPRPLTKKKFAYQNSYIYIAAKPAISLFDNFNN